MELECSRQKSLALRFKADTPTLLPKDIWRLLLGFLGPVELKAMMLVHSSFYRMVADTPALRSAFIYFVWDRWLTVSYRGMHAFAFLARYLRQPATDKGVEFVRQFACSAEHEGYLAFNCGAHVVLKDPHGYKSREDYAKGEVAVSGFLDVKGRRVFCSFDDEGYLAVHPNGPPERMLTWRTGHWPIAKGGVFWPSCIGTQMDSLDPTEFLATMKDLFGFSYIDSWIFLLCSYNWIRMGQDEYEVWLDVVSSFHSAADGKPRSKLKMPSRLCYSEFRAKCPNGGKSLSEIYRK
jgi:hypothetical protein